MKYALLALSFTLLSPSSFAAKSPKGALYKVDVKASVARWEGRKLGGAHHGELRFKDGTLKVENGALTGGEVTIDMTSLRDFDLTDDEMNAKLINHLKSDDFFSIAQHPISTLKITKVEPRDGKTFVTGDLTIKGVTNPVTFPAEVGVEKGKLTAKGTMTVDRTLYGIKFRSLKFFADIGDKVIKDEFTVSVDLIANK